jgi:hypothetical protein
MGAVRDVSRLAGALSDTGQDLRNEAATFMHGLRAA